MAMTQIDRPLEPIKKAIVIGASSGIGAALVHNLSKRGYRVAALARREAELTAVCDAVDNVTTYVHDVTNHDTIPDLFQKIVRDLGGLDVVIYNAGVQPEVAPDEYDFTKDHYMVNVNLLGAMAWLNQAAQRFNRIQHGSIAAVSSVAGDRGRSAFPGYHTSKGALSIYMESLRNRLAKRGVTITTIKPGFVDTPLLENADKTFWVISAADAAHQIVNAIEAGKQTIYIPARWRWVMLIIKHIPSFIFRRMSI